MDPPLIAEDNDRQVRRPGVLGVLQMEPPLIAEDRPARASRPP